MKFKKYFCLLLSIMLLFLTLTGCGQSSQGNSQITTTEKETSKKYASSYNGTTLNLAVIRDLPGAYTLLELMKESSEYKNKINFIYAKDTEEVYSLLDSGKADAATLTMISAFRYYNNGVEPIKLLYASSKAPIYLLSRRDDIRAIRDLGKQIFYFAEQYSCEEYALQTVSENNTANKTSGENYRYAGSFSNLIKKIEAGQVDYCVVASNYEPVILKKFPEFSNILTLNDAIYDCLVISQNYAEEHSDDMDDLNTLFKTSSVFTNFNKEEAQELAVKYKLASTTAIAEAVMSQSSIGYNQLGVKYSNYSLYSSVYADNDYYYGEYPYSDFFS